MILVFMLLVQAGPVHAGPRFQRFCERFIQADPWPWAEEPAINLLERFRRTREVSVMKELVFRLRSGLLDEAEAATLRSLLE
jgi:hypothetical protein